MQSWVVFRLAVGLKFDFVLVFLGALQAFSFEGNVKVKGVGQECPTHTRELSRFGKGLSGGRFHLTWISDI